MVLSLKSVSEFSYASFVNTLSIDDETVYVDFTADPFLIPVAVLTLLIKIKEWLQQKKLFMFVTISDADISIA